MKTVLFLFILVSCGGPGKLYFTEGIRQPEVTEELKSSISYQEVASQVLAPKCLACHDSGARLQLDSYEKVFAQRKAIRKAVILSHSMPKAPISPLTMNELKLVAAWIKAGAPLHPLNGSQGPDEGPTKVLEANFESIKSHIIDRKCITCHGVQARLPLVTKDDFLHSRRNIVIPHHPDESVFIQALQEGAKKFMPPKKTGFTSVSEKERAVIRQWILDGAIF